MTLNDGVLLYHGSYAPIQTIDLSLCAEGKDFGKGFYLTDNLAQAENFVSNSLKKAKNVKKIPNEQNFGYVMTYKFNMPRQAVPSFVFETTSKEWLWFVAVNRRAKMAQKFKEVLSKELFEAEIVTGKIANDTTNPTIMAYLDGLYGDIKSDTAINFAINQLMPHRLNDQYCFLTERAISCLELVEVTRYEQ